MKNTLILLVLFILQNNTLLAQDSFPELKEINMLLKEEKYEEAARFIANTNKSEIQEGYRSVAWFLSRENHKGKNSKTIKEYYTKGCEGRSNIACVDYGIMLEHFKQYEKAEKVYINIENTHKDVYSSERLYILYNRTSWNGYDPVKSKYWRNIYMERAQERSKERQKALRKYNLNNE